METFKNILKENMEGTIVIHTKNKTDIDDLIESIDSFGMLRWEVPEGLGGKTPRDYIKDMVLEHGTDNCFNFTEGFLTCNPSLEHWRSYKLFIVEAKDREVILNTGYSSHTDALIESKKIIFKYGVDFINDKYNLNAKDTDNAIVLLTDRLLAKQIIKKKEEE